jgi:adenylate cyclase
MTCEGCGFAAAPDFAFCPKCGRRLSPAAPPSAPGPAAASRVASHPPAATADADRRPVTLLFADVAGFTALGERLDPEDVRAFQDDLFGELSGAIDRHGGFVEKFVGDAVLAVFGAPVAHEDDAERALHAALALHRRMVEIGRRWEPRLGAPLALHVGVHTGPVVAGTLGDAGDGAYAVTGDTVNTAARLQGAAPPGHTLVTRATHLLTEHAFAFEPVGEIQLRGKAEPVAAFRLLGPLDAPRRRRGLEAQGLAAPLVGRDAELGELLAAFDRVAAGRAEVVSVVGEAGLGKSRLVDEFLARLAATGRLEHVTVRRTGGSSTGERAYGVLAAFFRQGYGIAASDPPEAARRKLAAGLEALGADDGERARTASVALQLLGLEREPLAPHVDPEQLRAQIVLAMRTLFERRLARGPMVLVIEDLHWADAASAELFCFLADRLADRPLLLVFTSRPASSAAAVTTERARRTAVHLAALPAGHCEALLAQLFGASAGEIPRALQELVVRRAGGNPFYLEEIVRELIADGVLVRESGTWRCAGEVTPADVPVTVQRLILSRLDRLPPEARRVAQEAAVIGPEFEASLLRLICGDAPAEHALALLEGAGLVRAVAGPAGAGDRADDGRRYAFSHALVQEAIYQNLLVRRRTELHGRVGRTLEALCDGGDGSARLEDLELLGHHFSLSADRRRGAAYLTRAGDRARAVYANADAIRHYERALGTLDGGEPAGEDRAAVEERLADVLALTGRREAARRHYAAVRGAAAADGDRARQARVWRKLALLHWDAGEREPALEALRTGLTLLGDLEHIEVAHLHHEMGRMAFRRGDSQAAVEWTDRALAHVERLAARDAGEPAPDDARERGAAVSHAYNTRGVALARLGRLDEAVAQIAKSIEIAGAHDLLQVACRGYANLGVLYSTLDPGRAIETCRSGLEIAKRIGDLGFQSRLYANLAVAYCALTNRCDDDGIAAAQAAIEIDHRLGQLDHLAVPLVVLGQIYQCHGEPERARRYYLEALSLAERVGEPQLLFPCYDGLATLHLDLDDSVTAERYMRQAQEVCERAAVDPDALMVLPFLC